MALARLRRVRWGFEAVAVYGREQSWPLSTYVRRRGREAAAEAPCNELTVARFLLQLRSAFQKLREVSSSAPLCSLGEECESRDAGCVLHTVPRVEFQPEQVACSVGSVKMEAAERICASLAFARLRRVRWGFEAVAVSGREQSWPLSTYVRRRGKAAAAEALLLSHAQGQLAASMLLELVGLLLVVAQRGLGPRSLLLAVAGRSGQHELVQQRRGLAAAEVHLDDTNTWKQSL